MPHSSQDWEVQDQDEANLLSGVSYYPGLQTEVFLLSSYTEEKKKQTNSLGVPHLLRVPILLGQDFTLMTSLILNFLLKALSPNTVALKRGLQYVNFARHSSVHDIPPCIP